MQCRSGSNSRPSSPSPSARFRHQSELLQRNAIADDSLGPRNHLDDQVPDEAESLSDAAAKAQLHLSDRLVLPDEALRDLNDLDSTVGVESVGPDFLARTPSAARLRR